MSKQTKQVNARKNAPSFNWTTARNVTAVKALSNKGEYVWTIGKLLCEAHASTTKHFEHVATSILETSALTATLSYDKESNEYVAKAISATTLATYQKLYSFFVIHHSKDIVSGIDAGVKSLESQKDAKPVKKLDVKSFFVTLVSLQLNHASTFVRMSLNAKQKSLLKFDVHTLAKWIQQGKTDELRKQLPKPTQVESKTKNVPIERAKFADIMKIKERHNLKDASFEDTLITLDNRHRQLSDYTDTVKSEKSTLEDELKNVRLQLEKSEDHKTALADLRAENTRMAEENLKLMQAVLDLQESNKALLAQLETDPKPAKPSKPRARKSSTVQS